MSTPPTIEKKFSPPPGLLRKSTQTWVVLGLAFLMVVVIIFSDKSAPKAIQAKDKFTPLVPLDANQARIQEYRTRIEEQARKLADEQAQLAHAKQAVVSQPLPRTSAPTIERTYEPSPRRREKSWIEQDREKREYQSSYASNVVLSFRTAKEPGARSSERPESSRKEGKAGGQNFSAEDRGRADKKTDAMINQADGKEYRLFEGTIIETVLTNRLDGAFSGPVNCMVTEDVHSHNRQHLLIPKGSRVVGDVKRVDAFGQRRLAVAFHRLIMPDGYSVSLDQFKGLSQPGETGLRDKVNNHYMQVFGVSLAIGSIAGLAQANTRYGLDVSGVEAYGQGVAGSLSQSTLRILDRYLNVLPTFTIREGQRIKIYLSDDLLLPAYQNHRMPEDI